MFRRFLHIRPISRPSSLKSLHLNRPKYNFSEQPNSNVDEFVRPKRNLLTSFAIGGVSAAFFAFVLSFKNPSKKEDLLEENVERSSIAQSQTISEEKKTSSLMQGPLDAALELHRGAMKKLSMGETDAGQKDMELALEILKNASEGESVNAAGVYCGMGIFNQSTNNIPQAHENFNKAVEIYEKNGLTWQVFETLVISALSYERDEDGGEAYYEKIFKKGQEKLAKNDPILAFIYIEYGMWHLGNKRNKKGIECLGKANHILKNGQKEAKKEDVAKAYRRLILSLQYVPSMGILIFVMKKSKRFRVKFVSP